MITTNEISQDTISNLSSHVDNLEINNVYLRDTIFNLTTTISNLTTIINTQQNIIEEQNMSINSTQEQLSLLQNGTFYSLHDPTYAEAQLFIHTDCTDSYTYKLGTFECDEFAEMFNNNAESLGIRCGFVIIEFGDAAHALNAFNTVDKGIIYIEPQNDEQLVHLNLGDSYWEDCFETNYGTQSFNNTITSINIIW